MPRKSKASIAFFELEKWEMAHIKKALKGHKLHLFPGKLEETPLQKIKDIEILSVFIYSKVDKSVLSKLPNLKFVSTRSTGFDHIDLGACKRKGITVSNVPFYGENTVAEHTFALILALSRNVHKAYIKTIKGDFSVEGLRGFDLKGKTLGVIGAGHIGQHVIRIAKGFGMDVLAYDPHKDVFLAEVLGFKYASLDDLLRNSNIITLHTPLNKHTRHMINKKNIGTINRGALLINTARGGLIDTETLTDALDKGILGGAALDVLEEEDLIKEERQLLAQDFPKERLAHLVQNHILMHRENVVITPHMAFNSQEALERILDTTLDNISAFMGSVPVNVIKT